MLLVTGHLANSEPKLAARAEIIRAGSVDEGERQLRAIAADPMCKKMPRSDAAGKRSRRAAKSSATHLMAARPSASFFIVSSVI